MALLTPMFNGLKAAVAAAWPDLNPSAIYRSETADMIPWDELPTDYSVIVASNFSKMEWGAAQMVFAGPVQIMRIVKWGAPGQDDAGLQLLDDLLSYLGNNEISGCQINSYDGLDWGDEIEGNAVVASKTYNHRIIRLQCTVMIGYC